MELKDVSAFLDQNKDNDEVKTFVNSFYTADRLNPVLDSEDGLKLLQPRLDKYHTKGLESWKTNNLSSLVETEIKKRFPAETDEQKRLRTIEDELSSSKKTIQQEKIKNLAITKLTESKMPLGFADLILADDEENFTAKFNSIKTIWDKEITERIKDEIKKGGRIINKNDDKKLLSSEMNSLIRQSAGIK